MTSTRWRSVLVVNAMGKPLGVVSGLDLLAYCDLDDCKDKTVVDVMHPVLRDQYDRHIARSSRYDD